VRILSYLTFSCLVLLGCNHIIVCVAYITATDVPPGITGYLAGLRSGFVADNGEDVYAHMGGECEGNYVVGDYNLGIIYDNDHYDEYTLCLLNSTQE
jgi:hypothetical protein